MLDPLGSLLGRRKKSRANSDDDRGDERMLPPVDPPTQPSNVSPEAPSTTATVGTQTAGGGAPGSVPRGLNFTPIILHKPDPTPFTDTRTVEHKLVTYCSVNLPGHTPADGTDTTAFNIRLNDPYTTFIQTGSLKAQTANTAVVKGVSCHMAPPNNNNPGDLLEFPRTMRNASGGFTGTPKLRMSWIEWYRKQYKYYHVCQTDVKITITHAHKSVSKSDDSNWGNSDRTIAVGYYRNSLSGDPNDNVPFSTTDIPNDTNGWGDTTQYGIANFEKFRGIKWKYVTNPMQGNTLNQGGHTQVITETYRDTDIPDNVKNLDQAKQWYATGASPTPFVAEELRLMFIRGPQATGSGSVNCKIEVTQLVQYKDLRPSLRFVDQPTHGNYCIHLRPGIDDVQYPYPSRTQRKLDYLPDVPTYPTT